MAEDVITRRIQALLDKAASTTFAAEAEAATAKALELMARHHIDEALLEARRHATDPSRIVSEEVDLGRGPYVNGRLRLLAAISEAFSVRCLTSSTPDGRLGHVIGYAPDVGRVQVLYTSLHAQAASRMATVGPGGPAGTGPGRRTPSTVVRFRRAFLFGFAATVGERLAAANQAAMADVPASTALVLADRTARVDDWIHGAYGRVGTHRSGAAPGAGWEAGASAGSAADLGGAGSAVGAPARAIRS
jgi:hypothetical protein